MIQKIHRIRLEYKALLTVMLTLLLIVNVYPAKQPTSGTNLGNRNDRGTDWLMQQNDKGHTGYTSGTGSIVWPGVKWQYTADSSGFKFGAGAVIGNTYSGSPNEIVMNCDDGNVYCVDSSGSSATLVWSKQLSNEWAEATPAIGNIDGGSGIEVLISGWMDYVYCLNGATGAIKWTSPWLNNRCDSAPVYGDVDNDGVIEVVVQSYSADGLCVLNGNTGDVERTMPTSGLDSFSPAIGNVDGGSDIEIIGLSNYRVMCYSGSTGSLKWQSPMTDNFLDSASDPTIADVDNDGNVEVIAVTVTGQVYCFNGYDGSIKWQCSTGYSLYSHSPAVANVDADSALEVVAVNDHKVVCISGSTGAVEWQSPYYNFYYTSPAIADIDGDGNKEIVVVNDPAEVLCFAGSSGALKWAIDASSESFIDSPPALGDVDGDSQLEIVVGDESGVITCIDQGVNNNPVLSNYDGWPDGVDPDLGLQTTTFTFKVHYYDQEGQNPSVKNVVIDSNAHSMSGSGANNDYSYQQSGFTTGTHNYYFYFEDGYGGTARLPATGTWTFTVITNTAPNTPSTPQGQTIGFQNIPYTYTTSTTDPDGNNIYYQFNWGDGTYSGWLGPYATGVECSCSHSWSTAGTYNVRAEAKDTWDAVSSWSSSLSVNIYNPTTSRYAVVIGNEHYLYGNDLDLPIEDATDVKNTLINKGWSSTNIHFVTDATASTMETQLNWLRDQEGQSSISLIYYAGHGDQIIDQNGDETDGLDEVLCGTDYNITSGYLSDDWMKSKLDEFQGTVVMVLDCCFSGGMNRTLIYKMNQADENIVNASHNSESNGFAEDLAGSNRELLCAAQEDEYSYENDTLNNGLFTYFFVEGCGGGADANNNHVITAAEAFNYADTHTRDWQTNNWGFVFQHPIMHDEYDGDIPIILFGANPNAQPNVPDTPSPYDGENNVALDVELSVHVSDPDGDTMSVIFYWANNTEIGIDYNADNGTRASFNLTGLQPSTLYQWYTIASDGMSDTMSPTWEFTTGAFGNHPPYPPSAPNPADGAKNVDPVNLILSVLASDPDGDTMNVSFFDASNDQLIGIDPGVVNGSKASVPWTGLVDNTTYSWYTIADDGEYLATSDTWSFTTKTEGNRPPEPPSINGPNSGKPGTEYFYTLVTTDPEGDNVYYQVDWGDGSIDHWYGPYQSNDVITRNHTWQEQGTYTIKARAKDTHGAISNWTSLEVRMPLPSVMPFLQFLEKLFERFPHVFPILRRLLG